MSAGRHLSLFALLFVMLAAPIPAAAQLDLSRAQVTRLDNGLTVILLEERAFPLVSVQMIYRSGARDEPAGGLAHFVEHLAFRGSEAFPDGAATDAIYDAGGEWHGYTWLDQTAYFATMPTTRDLGREPAGGSGLDLLLRIEADRMARVAIDAAAVEAERGAVLAELHGYANDPQSSLFDAVAAAAFGNHPYRANTIGSATDVAALTAAQARAFYEAHYMPANAVLAIVGDVAPAEAMALVRRHFGALPARAVPERVVAVEPARRGERRVEIVGPALRSFSEAGHFELAYPAPAASSPDFPAFLVLQQLLSGGSGVNFRQNDWGTPSVPGSALHGATGDVASWFIPTAEPYLMTITGSLAAGADRAVLEAELERRIARFRDQPPAAAAFDAAKTAVAEQLIFDIETTEDAAHQLAFFEALGAYDRLLDLPDRVQSVTAADLLRVARAYLTPQQRTVGWYLSDEAAAPPGPAAAPNPPRNGEGDRPAQPDGGGGPTASPPWTVPTTARAPAPQLRRLSGGLPAIVQPSSLSPTATVSLLLTAPIAGEEAPPDLPGLAAITRSGLAADLPELVADARSALAADPPQTGEGNRTQRGGGVPTPAPDADTTLSHDPETRLEQMIAAEMAAPTGGAPAPIVAVVSGAVDPDAAFAALEQTFGAIAPAAPPRLAVAGSAPGPSLRTVTARIDRPRAQAALGYVVAAPPPGEPRGPRLADAALRPHPRLWRPPRRRRDPRPRPDLPYRKRLPNQRRRQLDHAGHRRRPRPPRRDGSRAARRARPPRRRPADRGGSRRRPPPPPRSRRQRRPEQPRARRAPGPFVPRNRRPATPRRARREAGEH